MLQLNIPGLFHCITEHQLISRDDTEITSELLAPISGHGTVGKMLMTKWEHISMEILQPFSTMCPKEILLAEKCF